MLTENLGISNMSTYNWIDNELITPANLEYVSWDKSFIGKYYSSSYINHFYNKVELEKFWKKWR